MFGSNSPRVVGVRQHQAGDLLVGLRAQVVDVDAAVGVRADLHDLVAGHRHGRRVRAVRRVRGEDLRAVLAAVLVVGACEQDAGQLAVRAGGRLQRDVRQAGDLAERLLQVPHQLQRALRAPLVLQRVQARVARQRRDALVQLRVVLHRARAERVEAGVEVEVALAQAVVVAHQLRLADLRESRRLRAPQARRQQLVERTLGHVERGRDERATARLRALVDRQRVVGGRDRGASGARRGGGRDGARRGIGAIARPGAHAPTPLPTGVAPRSVASASASASAKRSICARVRCSVIATSRPSAYSG